MLYVRKYYVRVFGFSEKLILILNIILKIILIHTQTCSLLSSLLVSKLLLFLFCCWITECNVIYCERTCSRKTFKGICLLQPREPACKDTSKCVCVCFLLKVCVHSRVSLMPYFSQAWYDQMSGCELSVSLWPLAFVLEGEKRSKRWHSATSPLIFLPQDTDSPETSLDKCSS